MFFWTACDMLSLHFGHYLVFGAFVATFGNFQALFLALLETVCSWLLLAASSYLAALTAFNCFWFLVIFGHHFPQFFWQLLTTLVPFWAKPRQI